MQFDPSTVKYEEYIVWLRNPELYDYLRLGIVPCHARVRFPLKSIDPGKYTDGGPGSHIVAYAGLRPDAPSDWTRRFERRYWWVKEYDRFIGSTRWIQRDGTPQMDGYIDTKYSPCEAVDIDCIIAGFPSQNYDPDERLLAQ
jgi:hypothetical protein